MCPGNSGHIYFMKKFVFAFLSALLMISCNNDSEQDWGGMEYMKFEISGRVLDGESNPIKGILVSVYGSSVKTGSDGKYKLEGQGGTQTSLVVSFTDVDGVENGGLFYAVTQNVKLDYMGGKHGPFLGLYGKTGVDATLGVGLPTVPDFDTPVQ